MITSDESGQADLLGTAVDLVYDAALDDARWHAIAAQIAEIFSSPSAVLKTCGGGFGHQLESVTDNLRITAQERPWADHWHRNDMWVARSAQLAPGDVFTSQRLLPDTQFERTAFYQDWTRKLDIYHMVGVLFPAGPQEIGVLGVHRPKQAGAFEEMDRRRLEALFPHVRRALGIRHHLRGTDIAQQAALKTLEKIETGVVVVDSGCAVLYANRAAERILGSASGLRTRGRHLHIEDAGLHDRLARLVREAAQTAAGRYNRPGAALSIAQPARLPVTLLVTPWRAEWAHADLARPAAMVFLRDPAQSAASATQILIALHGLTRAEAVVAVAIGQGRSLEDIATGLDIGMGTVRTHLKKALAKTGTGRQAALAALVAHGIGGISDED